VNEMVDVFQFDDRWDEVLPHLKSPEALHALDVGMRAYCINDTRWRTQAVGSAVEQQIWDPSKGPWSYGGGDVWFQRSLDLAVEDDEWQDLSDQLGDDLDDQEYEECFDRMSKIEEQFYPQPDTPDWYRCWGACHWLAPWNCTIGKLVYPELTWWVVDADEHSNAVGIGDQGLVVMDILFTDPWVDLDPWAAVRSGDCIEVQRYLAALESEQWPDGVRLRRLAPPGVFPSRKKRRARKQSDVQLGLGA